MSDDIRVVDPATIGETEPVFGLLERVIFRFDDRRLSLRTTQADDVDRFHYIRSTGAISRIRETIAELQDEGATIEFLGSTQTIDGEGHPIEITVRYTAPTKRYIAWLNWHAELPVCGPPQYDEDPPPRTRNRADAVADTTKVES